MWKIYNADYKAKMAQEDIIGEKAITQFASKFGIHSNQIRKWGSLQYRYIEERQCSTLGNVPRVDIASHAVLQ